MKSSCIRRHDDTNGAWSCITTKISISRKISHSFKMIKALIFKERNQQSFPLRKNGKVELKFLSRETLTILKSFLKNPFGNLHLYKQKRKGEKKSAFSIIHL